MLSDNVSFMKPGIWSSKYWEPAIASVRSWLPIVFISSLLSLVLGPFVGSTLAFASLALVAQLFALSQGVAHRLTITDMLLGLFVISLIAGELLINPNLSSFLEFARWAALLVIARAAARLFGQSAILAALALFSTAMSVVIVLSAGMNLSIARFDGTSLITNFMHKNDVAAIVALGAISLWALLLATTRRPFTVLAMFGWASFVFLQIILFLLDSLTALGASAIALVALAVFHFSRTQSHIIRQITLLVYLSAPLLAVGAGQISGIFEMLGRRSDFHGRLEIWAFTVKDWGALWLFGSPGTYWTEDRSQAFDESTPLVGAVGVSDNSFLDIFLNQGILPVIVLTALAVWWIREISQSWRGNAATTSIAFPVIFQFLLIISFFSSTLLSPFFFFTFALAVFSSGTSKIPGPLSVSDPRENAKEQAPLLQPNGGKSQN